MTNDKKSSIEWLEQELKKIPFVNVLDVFDQAKEMEVAGREMSYNEGYKEGYKRALELIEWGIQQAKTK